MQTQHSQSQPKGVSRGSFRAFQEGKKYAWFLSDPSECYGGKTKRCVRSTTLVNGEGVPKPEAPDERVLK